MFLLLAAVMLVLLGGGCLPGHTFFSNDGPLGRRMSACHQLPERFTGCWQDLNSIGYRELAAVPSLTYGLECVLGPLWFSRLYMPLALLLLGLSAWGCFRQFGLAPAGMYPGRAGGAVEFGLLLGRLLGCCRACHYRGNEFSGPGGPGRHFLEATLAARRAGGLGFGHGRNRRGRHWRDIQRVCGGICCLAGLRGGGSARAGTLSLGVLRVAVAAAVCGARWPQNAVSELLATDVEGVVAATRARQPDQGGALGLGNTMEPAQERSPRPGSPRAVWLPRGRSRRSGATGALPARMPPGNAILPAIDTGPPPSGFLRFVGGGNYAGVPVVLLALWTAAQCFRRKNSAFDAGQRRLLWFWLGGWRSSRCCWPSGGMPRFTDGCMRCLISRPFATR